MKTREFIKRVEEFGLKVKSGTSVSGSKQLLFYIPRNYEPVVEVCVNYKHSFNTNWCGFSEMSEEKQNSLFKLLVEYASTPLEEREEEKKYYIKLPHIEKGFNFLIFFEDSDEWLVDYKGNFVEGQSQFTLKELPIWVHEMLAEGHLVKEEVE